MAGTNNESKNYRILSIHDRLNRGEVINKKDAAKRYAVDERTIQRDIADLKIFLEKDFSQREIVYDRQQCGYVIKQRGEISFSDSDIFSVCKILLDSRAFSKVDMKRILDTLVMQCDDRKSIAEMIANERFYYTPPKHDKSIIDDIWKISQSIRHQNIVNIEYEKQDGTISKYAINPVGLVFNEYYFYLIGEKNGLDNPISQVYRVDRLKKFEVTEDCFDKSEKDRFKEGEFRKRVQFMYTGALKKITFKFWGDSLEAVLDRLPTAKVINQSGKESIIEAEVYGEGVKRWLLSQCEYLEVLKPQNYRDEVLETLKKMRSNYR
nr:WYL domain-containing protein [uncultured Acetobacterium sp.]